MELRDCKEDKQIFYHGKLKAILGPDYEIKQFYLRDDQRDYDVYHLSTIDKSLILKLVNKKNELVVNNLLVKGNFQFAPRIHFTETYDDQVWMCMEFIDTQSKELEKADCLKLVETLGKLHTSFSCISKDHELNKWRRSSNEQKQALIDYGLGENEIAMIKEAESILVNASHTLIHDDMIPLNVIKSSQGVKIIDWEYGKYGPYALDLGRLLGDYYINQPWINSEWEEDMKLNYYQSIKDADLVTSYEQFLLEYECAKLENYLGVVLNFARRMAEKNEWYDLNLKLMRKQMKIIQGIKYVKAV